MKTKLFLGVLFLILIFQVSMAQVPETINYQGVLKDAEGETVADGTYSLTFKLYESETGGTAVWSEVQSVTTSVGVFSAILGSVTALDISLDQDS